MRRLQTQAEIEKRKKRTIAILSLFMLFIMVVSSLGYSFLSNTGSSSDNEAPAEQGLGQGLLKIDYGGQIFYLQSSQEEIKDIALNVNIIPQTYFGKNLYISSDNQGILQEISSTIGRFSLRAQEACYGQCEKNLPEKNCTDNLIVWKESAESKVSQEDNCVFIEGDMRTVDAFIYKVFS